MAEEWTQDDDKQLQNLRADRKRYLSLLANAEADIGELERRRRRVREKTETRYDERDSPEQEAAQRSCSANGQSNQL